MIKGKTKCGFEYSISKKITNDYELVELLADLEDNYLLVTKVARRVFGNDQYNALKEHVRDEDGFVATDKISELVLGVFTGEGEIKNS